MRRHIGALGLLLLSGCSAIEDMKEMKQMTKEMGAKMDQTNRNLDRTLSQTQDMKSTTGKIYDYSSMTYRDLRLGESAKSGFIALESLNKARSIEQKFVAAGFYFAAQEYQMWKSMDSDDKESRERMYAVAATRFFMDIREYIEDTAINEMKPPEKSDTSVKANNLKNLLALSAIMHEVNPSQKTLAKERNIQIVTMYDLLKEGLSAVREERKNKKSLLDAPEYLQIIAQNEEITVLMLQLRYNILSSKTLTLVSDIEEKKISKYAASWDIDPHKLNNSAKILYATKAAVFSNDTRNFLVSLGYPIPNITILWLPFSMDLELSRVFRNMNVDSIPKSPQTEQLVKALNELKGYYLQ